MQIRSIRDGGVIYKGSFSTIKRNLEQAVKNNINLSYADLRKADLRGAVLDDAILSGACFWGADLSKADISGAYLHNCDFRLALFKETCLAESVLTGCDFRGVSFDNTIFHECDLSRAQFSCPSLFRQDLSAVKAMQDCSYSHYGEIDCNFSDVPVRVSGLPEELVLLNKHVKIGAEIFDLKTYQGAYKPLISAALDMQMLNKKLTVC